MRLEKTREKRKATYKAKRAERLGLDPNDPNLPRPKITGQPRTRLDDARLSGKAVALSDKDHVAARLRRIAQAQGRTLPTLPGVQSLSIATRYLAGGRAHFVELVQAAALEGSTDAATWLAVYGDLPPYQQGLVSFDDVCAAAGVRPSRLVGDVTSYAVEMGRDVGNLVAAVTHPQVVEAAVRAAKQPKGTRDRELLFQHHNFTPVPRAAVINVNASATAQAAARSDVQATGQPPSFADDLRQIATGTISGSVTATPALPPVSVPDPLEGTTDAVTEYDYVDAE